jgi:short-subunit dehydrogenase
MSRRFEGKVVVITGASAGIGAAAARRFAGEGAAVALAARGVAPLSAVATELERSGARVLAVPTDVADAQAAERLLAHVTERFGGIDVLVNNAGMNKRGAIERYAPEELAAVVQVNLTAPIVLTRLVLPHLRARGRGAIVNVASIAGRIPVGHEAVYSATKFGLRAFTFAMEEELRGSGITISAVSPGPVETGFIMENLADVPDVVFAQPMSTADEVAKLILDCAADGTPERVIPQVTGLLATAGYLFPALRNVMIPMMEKRGQQAKEEYRKKRSGGAA